MEISTACGRTIIVDSIKQNREKKKNENKVKNENQAKQMKPLAVAKTIKKKYIE